MNYFQKNKRFVSYSTLPAADKKHFNEHAKAEVALKTYEHLSDEWGQFQTLEPMSDENIEKKIDKLLKEMTLEQKVNQMSSDLDPWEFEFALPRYNFTPYYAGEDYQLSIPAIKFTDGPTGVVMGYESTTFPVSMARGATFDTELEKRVGRAIGREARAQDANLFAGICINLVRHPAWGRSQETYGEDPYHLGEMGKALTEGAAEHVMTCIKHYALNSMENARFKVDIKTDERSLREIYLPHFKKCVDAGASSVMTAYNRVEGQWCAHNNCLIQDILYDEWGFDGFTMSDFIFGIRNTVDAANAGQCLEMNCTQFYGEDLIQVVNEGHVTENTIDEAVRRLLRQKIKGAIKLKDKTVEMTQELRKEHTELAREVSEKSTVLLKNNGVLPFQEDVKHVLVVGELALNPNIGDAKGSSAVFPPYVVTPLEGIKNVLKDAEVTYCTGINAHEVTYKSKQADAVIVIAGLTWHDEGEYCTGFGAEVAGGDRESLGLKDYEVRMINAVTEANANHVVVLQGGSSIITDGWDENVSALMMQWYPGMEGGNALANLLFGKANPSGKMPLTVYRNKQKMPYFDAEAEEMIYDFYHGYFLVDRDHLDVSYPFGYGLSYTSFEYSNLEVSLVDGKKVVKVTVKNTGEVAGEEVAQFYTGYVDSKIERHLKDLKGFKRVSIEPGASKEVVFEIAPEDLAYYSEESSRFVTEDIEYKAYVGSSSQNDTLLTKSFRLAGDM